MKFRKLSCYQLFQINPPFCAAEEGTQPVQQLSEERCNFFPWIFVCFTWWVFIVTIRQSNGIHRIYPNVGCIRLTEMNREVGIVFRFFPECIRMSVLCFSRILSNHLELDWIRLKSLNIFNHKIIYIQSVCVHTYIDLNLN